MTGMKSPPFSRARLADLNRRRQRGYTLRELGEALANPLGRRRLAIRLIQYFWPAHFRLAAFCRRIGKDADFIPR